jgi:hypothetical protein
MFPAPLFLALLIVTTPVILIFEGPIIHGLVMAAAALSVAIVALRIRPGEAGFLSSVIRPVVIVATVLALWIVVQVLPLKTVGLANPIWESAAAALGRPLAGSISIDPGATLISLARYLSLTAIAFVAAAVAIDRQRARWILYVLTATTSLIALMVLAVRLGGFTFLGNGDGGPAIVGLAARFGRLTFLGNGAGGPAINAATAIAGLGVVLAAAAGLHTFELGKMQTRDQGSSAAWLPPTFVASLVAVAICSLAVIVAATTQAYFAVACGVATLAVAVVIRRFRLGPWGYSAIVSVALVIAVALVVLKPGGRMTDLTLAFATRAPAPLIALTQRILTETSWIGTGAGTFAAVLPIYRDVDELAAGSIAPTAAAEIAVEMGRPFFWAILTAAIALAIFLLRGALRRGRDSFYSTAGASCIVIITLLAFGTVSVFNTSVLVITAAVIGLAVAQSKSRSI